MLLDMAIQNSVRLPREVREQGAQNRENAVQQQPGGTGVNAPVVPNQAKQDHGSQGGGSGGHSGQGHTDAHDVYAGLNSGAVDRVAIESPRAKPWMAADDVRLNVGTNSISTFDPNSLQRNYWEQKFTPRGSAKQLRVAGDMPNSWAKQIQDNVERSRVQVRPEFEWHVTGQRARMLRA